MGIFRKKRSMKITTDRIFVNYTFCSVFSIVTITFYHFCKRFHVWS